MEKKMTKQKTLKSTEVIVTDGAIGHDKTKDGDNASENGTSGNAYTLKGVTDSLTQTSGDKKELANASENGKNGSVTKEGTETNNNEGSGNTQTGVTPPLNKETGNTKPHKVEDGSEQLENENGDKGAEKPTFKTVASFTIKKPKKSSQSKYVFFFILDKLCSLYSIWIFKLI